MSLPSSPSHINDWFPLVRQTLYIDAIAGQSGLTRRQACCFIRLWGYASVQSAIRQVPIHTLPASVEPVSCSHRAAADLFYCDQSRGSERSAGMMIDQLVAKHLVKRETFDGGPTRLSLYIPHSFLLPTHQPVRQELYTDSFDVRQDASQVAVFLEDVYGWVSQRTETTSFKILKVLRRWAQAYPTGLRVLRAKADDETVGFAAFYPTHSDSEENFHRSPTSSLHLSTLDDHDPIRVASSGDEDCYAVFIRSWQIQPDYWNYSTVCQFLADAQSTLSTMRETFPNLCDMYAIAIHPSLETLAFALGFKPMKADATCSLRWIHMSLDQFIGLDIDETLADYDFGRP
ncbi:MAG: hypothetical protein ACFBSG_15050 [Leptolyngbyaceae cyanobacterium]